MQDSANPRRLDEEFGESWRGGDEKSFRALLERLIREFGPRLEGLLCRQFPQLRADAEDILAEAYVRALANSDKYDPDKGRLFTWVLRIAQNEAISRLRKRAAHHERPANDLLEGVAAPDASEPDPSFWHCEERYDLFDVLADLSEQDRMIVFRFVQSGGDGAPWAADLAVELKVDAAQLRVRKGRILEKIRDAMRRRGHQIADPAVKVG